MKQLWKMVKTTVLVAGILLSFFACAEMVRVYVTLRDVHHLLGYAFALVVVSLLLFGLFCFLRAVGSRPKVLVPPAIQDIDKAEKKELKKYCKYLVKYLKRLEDNVLLNPGERQGVRDAWEALERIIKINHPRAFLRAAIRDTQSLAIDPIQKKLDGHMWKEKSEALFVM